jgi:hypothetical protein
MYIRPRVFIHIDSVIGTFFVAGVASDGKPVGNGAISIPVDYHVIVFVFEHKPLLSNGDDFLYTNNDLQAQEYSGQCKWGSDQLKESLVGRIPGRMFDSGIE